MTITLELPPGTEANLVAQAEARGVSLGDFLRTIIAAQATAAESMESLPSSKTIDQNSDWLIDDL